MDMNVYQCKRDPCFDDLAVSGVAQFASRHPEAINHQDKGRVRR